MMDSLESGLGNDADKVRENFKKQLPLGRYAQEEEIAQTAYFLLSNQSSYTTGAVFMIDGGLTA